MRFVSCILLFLLLRVCCGILWILDHKHLYCHEILLWAMNLQSLSCREILGILDPGFLFYHVILEILDLDFMFGRGILGILDLKLFVLSCDPGDP